MKNNYLVTLIAVCAITSCLLIQPAIATVTFTAAGSSAKNVAVDFEAQLTISGDILAIQLTNNSIESLNPDDLLSSFYFDITNGSGDRPALFYESALGDVWIDNLSTGTNTPDVLVQANADLKAVNQFDNTWEFKPMIDTASPFLGFGLGTVGNSNLSPNSFSGNLVNGADFSIFVGEISTANLGNTNLVKNTATFTFSGVSGFTESDVSVSYAFGLGTAPDSLLIPEPCTLLLLGFGAGTLALRKPSR